MSTVAAEDSTVPKAPAVRAPKFTKAFDSESVKPAQKPAIVMPPIDQPYEAEPDIVIPDLGMLKKEQLDRLRFNEEPVTIFIHRSGERNASKVTDLVAVNGIKAEVLFKNGWVQIGWLPRGVTLTTKRKYVEQLAHSKVDEIRTDTGKVGEENPRNVIERSTRAVCSFSVVHDPNPRGSDWLESILRQ